MSSVYCLSVRFLDPIPRFHGRGDGGQPEWPPSPLRLFQALVAASAARWRGDMFSEYAKPALQWIETRLPTIVAVSIHPQRTPYRMYVPNNAGDLVTADWARGNLDSSMAKHRVEKDIRPTRLVGGDCVHYCWNLPETLPPNVEAYLNVISSVARSITHLGWGIDMVAADAKIISQEESRKLSGEVWQPSLISSEGGLRTPKEGTLQGLIEKHEAFLGRLGPDGFKPVPPLSEFDVVGYRLEGEPLQRPFAAFSILKLDASGFRPFDTERWGRRVAGMLRHATCSAAKSSGWTTEKTNTFVLGHGESPGEEHKPVGPKRFAYLPLPSIEWRGDSGRAVSSIRRAIIAVFAEGCQTDVAWARRYLSGVELLAEPAAEAVATKDATQSKSGDPVALLSLLPESDEKLAPYVKPFDKWITVTPVALPGYDDGRSSKTDKLIRKMLHHAGYSLDWIADLDCRRVPYIRGAGLADRYRPSGSHYLSKCSLYHMRIRWKRPMPGPIALGSGRYCGLGLFAADY